MLTVQATLPAKAASDVANSVVTLNITNPDGTVLTPSVMTIPRTSGTDTFTFSVASDAIITTSQVDVDGSGNRSPATASGPFTAADTFPPPAPGAIGFAVIGQTD